MRRAPAIGPIALVLALACSGGGSPVSGGASGAGSAAGAGTGGSTGGGGGLQFDAAAEGQAGATGGAGLDGSIGDLGTDARGDDGADASAPVGATCGSVVNCGGNLCADPANPECPGGGCLHDQRDGFDFYCSRRCDTGPVCPTGYSCGQVNVAGGGAGRYCIRYLAVCGNGMVDPGEACDDGNKLAGDGCSADCRSNETCGNGIKDPGESCDDRNSRGGDGCSADCRSNETCGNGMRDLAEECDDGNAVPGDGCEPDCSVSACGNGRPTPPEACDAGPMGATTGCDSQCRIGPVSGTTLLSRYPMDSTPFIAGVLTAAAPSGRLFASWAAGGGNSTMSPRLALTSSDNGLHWQGRQTIDSPSAYPDTQKLLRGTASGQLVLWWTSGLGIKLRRSTDNGVTWGPTQTSLIPEFDHDEKADMIAVGTSWLFTWADWDGTKYSNWFVRSPDAGATWSKPVRFDPPAPERSMCGREIGLVADGPNILATTCGGIAASHDGGLTFVTPTVVPNSDDLWGVDVGRAVAAAPGVYVIPSRSWSLVWRATDGFRTLTRIQLGTTVEGAGGNEVVRDASGALLWVWRDKLPGGETAVVLRRSVDQGQTWSPSTTVASGSFGAAGIAAGPGASYVWWIGNEAGGPPQSGTFRLRPTTDGGLTFGSTLALSKFGNNLSSVRAFLADSNGGFHVFWMELTNPQPNKYYLYTRKL